MIKPLTFPDTRAAVFDLIAGQEFAGHTVQAYYRLQPDFTDRLPAVLVYELGGTANGGPQKIDRLGIDVYAVGSACDQVAEAICSLLITGWHMTDSGRIDRIVAEATPHDVPYADPAVNQNSAVYRATVRPL